jgi:hypothetical protein
MWRILATLGLCAIVGCKGADGAAGPQGPQGAIGPQGAQGPQGPIGAAGSLNRADFQGVTASDGSAVVQIPLASVNGKLPVVACWISDVGSTWLQVAQDPTTTTGVFCGLTGTNTTAPAVTLIRAPAAWRYWIVVAW